MPHIQQQECQADISVRFQIAINQFCPAAFFCLCNLCISIPRQIDKGHWRNLIEVDGCGFSGNGTDSRQCFPVENFIQHRGLSHIGTPCKCNLHALARRQLGKCSVRCQKCGLLKVHPFLLLYRNQGFCFRCRCSGSLWRKDSWLLVRLFCNRCFRLNRFWNRNQSGFQNRF